MSFTLYNAPQSTCSQRVRFVLNAKKLSFAEVKLDLLAGDQLKPEYLALNPNGVVPTLDHDGAIVIDSSVIIEYLDEIAPAPASFTPRDPVVRAKMRALMRFIDEMPAAAVRVPTFNLAFLPRFAAMSEDEFWRSRNRSRCARSSCWRWDARDFRRRTCRPRSVASIMKRACCAGSSLKMPVNWVVMVATSGFFTPRIDMH